MFYQAQADALLFFSFLWILRSKAAEEERFLKQAVLPFEFLKQGVLETSRRRTAPFLWILETRDSWNKQKKNSTISFLWTRRHHFFSNSFSFLWTAPFVWNLKKTRTHFYTNKFNSKKKKHFFIYLFTFGAWWLKGFYKS